MNHPALWYFERFGLLQGLSDEEKQKVSAGSEMLHMKRGDPIYLPGDPSKFVYLVKSGAVKIVGRSPEGGEVILTVLMPGDIFGELALASEDSRDERAEAADDTLLCEVPRQLLLGLIRDNPAFALQITKVMGLRLRTLRSRIEELLGKSASARLAHALVDLADQYGIADREGILIPVRLTQADLAKLVGLTRETVNGFLQAWREQGLVETDRRRIRLRDVERLKRVR